MRCGTARRILWTTPAPREVTPDTAAAEAHLQQCAPCRRFVADQAALAAALRAECPALAAPTELRDRVFDALASRRTQQPASRRTGWRPATAALAVLALAAAGAAWLFGEGPERALQAELRAVAAEHNRVTHETRLMSSDRNEVRDWLAQRLAFAPHVPTLAGATLEGARICDLNGRRGAVVCYRVRNEPLSFYLLPTGSSEPSLPPAELVGASDRGNRAIAWQGGGLTHALVANLPESTLRDFAARCLHAGEAPPGS